MNRTKRSTDYAFRRSPPQRPSPPQLARGSSGAVRPWRLALGLLACLASAAAATALVGCDEIGQNVTWSPDGNQAAVIGTKGLYFCDGDGRLSGLLIEGVTLARWLPDSRRLLVVRRVDAGTWTEASALLTPEERDCVARTAHYLLDQYPAEVSLAGDFDPQMPSDLRRRALSIDRTSLFLYARDEMRPALEKKFGPSVRPLWEQPDGTQYSLRLVELYDVAGGKVTPGPILARSLADVAELRLAPGGRAAAFTALTPEQGACDLFVVNTDGASPARCAADRVAAYPDWSADGRLVYARAAALAGRNDALRLGSIRRLPACSPDGPVSADFRADQPYSRKRDDGTEEMVPSPGEDVVGLLFTPLTQVRCLKDGTIFFSSLAATLPATDDDMPQRSSLFRINPETQRTVSRAVSASTEQRLTDGVYRFEPSPDGKRVAVAGLGGQVTVLTPATGAVEELSPHAQGAHALMVPTWRSDQELTFARAEDVNGGRPGEIYLWSVVPGQEAKRISRSWPDDVLKALRLDRGGPAVAPATAPAAPSGR